MILVTKFPAVVVIRTDGIGDYILMHNFLYYVKNSEKYKDKKLVFIGRQDFSQLSEQYDYSIVDKFIWINFDNWMSRLKKIFYRRFIYLKLFGYRIDTIISPVHEKDTLITESLIHNLKAKEVIGCKGPDNRITKKYKNLYTELIDTGDDFIFEFDRNKIFFEKLLNIKIDINRPFFAYPLDINQKYIFISPWSGDTRRNWNEKNFAEVINYLVSNYDYKCVILGSKVDLDNAAKLLNLIDSNKLDKVINAVGTISLSMLPVILERVAKLLISVDTGTVHIAAATNIPFLVISSGMSYGKFHPYKNLEDSYIYPDEVDKMLEEEKNIFDFYYNKISPLDINTINSTKVIKMIKNVLGK